MGKALFHSYNTRIIHQNSSLMIFHFIFSQGVQYSTIHRVLQCLTLRSEGPARQAGVQHMFWLGWGHTDHCQGTDKRIFANP